MTRIRNYTFEDPEQVAKGASWFDYAETYLVDGYYEPPVPFESLAKAIRANSIHSSASYCKRNILVSTLERQAPLSLKAFRAFVLDYLIYGNAYLHVIRSRTGRIVDIKHLPALHMRVAENQRDFVYIAPSYTLYDYKGEEIIYLAESDFRQEIYGLPEYMGALNAVWLKESSLLFKRRYYENGAHMGFILYTNDPSLDKETEERVREKIEQSRGVGNFKNLFINGRGKQRNKVEVMPIGNLAANDEFLNINQVADSSIYTAWRIPPQLMSVIPTNVGGFGSVTDAANVFYRNEIMPLQQIFLDINDQAGIPIISAKEYNLSGEQSAES